MAVRINRALRMTGIAAALCAILPAMTIAADAQEVLNKRMLIKQLRLQHQDHVDGGQHRERVMHKRAPQMMRAPEAEDQVVQRRGPKRAPGAVATMRAPDPVFEEQVHRERVVRKRAPQPDVAEFRAPEAKPKGKPKPKAAGRPPAPKAKEIEIADARDDKQQRGLKVKTLPREEPALAEAASTDAYPGGGRVDLEILFDYDSDRIDPKSVKQLIELGEALNDPELGRGAFMIAGHTDAAGSDAYNADLSRRRAQAVTEFLVSYAGVEASRLVSEGYGEELLKYPDAPESGQNRRVEIINLGDL